jgi:hypothetical protein
VIPGAPHQRRGKGIQNCFRKLRLWSWVPFPSALFRPGMTAELYARAPHPARLRRSRTSPQGEGKAVRGAESIENRPSAIHIRDALC